MQKIKLSQLLKANNSPKIFFFTNSHGKEVIFADTKWLEANFLGQRLFDELATTDWGTKSPMYAYDEVENDTDNYRGHSIDTISQKTAILAEIENYKLLKSFKIEVLVP